MSWPRPHPLLIILFGIHTSCVDPPPGSVNRSDAPDLQSALDMTSDEGHVDSHTDLGSSADLTTDQSKDTPQDSDSPIDLEAGDMDMASDADMPPVDTAPSIYGDFKCMMSADAATGLIEGIIEIGKPFTIETKRLDTEGTGEPAIIISPTTSVNVGVPNDCGNRCIRREFTIAKTDTYTLTIYNQNQDRSLQTCTITF